MLLGRNHGYVYYEADVFGMFANPFVDPNVDEPTLAIMTQKPLKVKQFFIILVVTIVSNFCRNDELSSMMN